VAQIFESPNLKRLNLSYNPIQRGVLKISQYSHPPYLEDDYEADMSGMHALCKVIKTKDTLSHLALSYCNLDFLAVKDLTAAILENDSLRPPNRCLKKIDLELNKLGDDARGHFRKQIDAIWNAGLPKRMEIRV
jgi:hypothetical protein